MPRKFNYTFGDWTRTELTNILDQDFEGSEEAVGAMMVWTDAEIEAAFERAAEKLLTFLHDGPPLLDYFLESVQEMIEEKYATTREP